MCGDVGMAHKFDKRREFGGGDCGGREIERGARHRVS